MFTILSIVTSVKDYIEIVHKLVETPSQSGLEVTNYYDLGAILTYLVLTGKSIISGIFTFQWLKNLASLPLIVPDIASAMISEISVLDGYLHNAFTFLETPISYGNQNILFYAIEKLSVGLINSIFLFLPTSAAHIITLRRFMMQGLEAGYLAGLGTLAGNLLWIGSILFGLRFIVIPWLSLDILRYSLGFLLLVKYMWDSYNERRTVLEDLSKRKIFLLNFLLAFTEQSTLFPFLNNISIGSDATILESFPTGSFLEYTSIHFCYLGGLFIGGLSLLQLACWFWENPAFNIYMWAISSFKITTTFSQKFINTCFLYLTMFFAVSNFSYFGFDYTVTNPLGFVHEDRLIDQKSLLETSFLNTKASDRNTRRNRGRHGRRERWKRRVRRYRTFDASLYDQGVYDLFTIEDLNYGFDRFWLRRKIRNHRVRFRFFPGPWMRSFKKQLARPRLESFMGPRVEFFRILFEQAYHPEFHEFRDLKGLKAKPEKASKNLTNQKSLLLLNKTQPKTLISIYSEKNQKTQKENLTREYSALRKFIRKIKTRTNTAQILLDIKQINSAQNSSTFGFNKLSTNKIYSKRWKQIFSKISHNVNQNSGNQIVQQKLFNNFYKQIVLDQNTEKSSVMNYFKDFSTIKNKNYSSNFRENGEKQLSKKDRQILRYKTFLTEQSLNSDSLQKSQSKSSMSASAHSSVYEIYKPLTLLHPLKFYLRKEKAFTKKMKFYGASLFRNFGIENNAPYYRIMMKKFFYYYKPTLRWERTMRTATMRKARRKGPRIPRKLNISKQTQALALNSKKLEDTGISSEINSTTKIQRPTHFYSLVSKRATRYRYQIYKDVLQHWYYSPFNRLLLKFDVDSFIRRQPVSHFLTKKEENLLHLKRFLLADYYNTLRWYSYMQHYESMKTTIGKTKSFSSGSYNQQFFGTFKKIRHLFAITPSLTENTILKFDQPLFNELQTSEKNFNKNSSFYNSSLIHEELLADDSIYSIIPFQQNLSQDLTNQSTKIVKEYLTETIPTREAYIQKLITEKNYEELTNFLFKGQKIRGTQPVTNENSLLNQEKTYLLSINEKNLEKEKIESFFTEKIFSKETNNDKANFNDISINNSNDLWISLMKKSRNMLYNQEALKMYVSGRVEKLEKQKKREEKTLNRRLEIMKTWVNLENNKKNFIQNNNNNNNNLSGLTTSLQKAIKEGLYYQIAGSFSGKKLEKSNLRNNREKIFTKLSYSIKSTKNKKTASSNLSVSLKNHLKQRLKLKTLKTIEAENHLKNTFNLIQNSQQNSQSQILLNNVNPNLVQKIFNQTLVPFKFVAYSIQQKLESVTENKNVNTLLDPIKSFFQFFTKNKHKNFENWKKRETVFSTRKKIRRKIYRVLDQKKQIQRISNIEELENLKQKSVIQSSRQKQDLLNSFELERRQKSWETYKTNKLEKNMKSSISNTFSGLFEKNFKRKRTRGRRYRRFKGRGPIKKHTLAEKLKRQFKLLKRYGQQTAGQDKKIEILQMITKREYNPNSSFETRETKQRRTRQSKHRYWKKHKRQKYLQTKRKQRKRRRYTISKLRVLNKEFKRIKSQLDVKNWWWQSFLPNFKATKDAYWQIEKNKQIQDELSKLSLNDILERDQSNPIQKTSLLQIGNQDFKPLSIPEALNLRESLSKTGKLNFGEQKTVIKSLDSTSNIHNISDNTTARFNTDQTSLDDKSFEKNLVNNDPDLISNLSKNLFQQSNINTNLNNNYDTKKLVNVNPIPFYAGWDETLRQFVVTNRLLSRKDAGYAMNFALNSNENSTTNFTLDMRKLLQLNSKVNQIEFTKAPLLGMNAATTLYWQIPFTTYDPDQFFALGMDGFSPLGWRFFNFKHSKETTKPILVNNIFATNKKTIEGKALLSYNIQLKFLNLSSKNPFTELDNVNLQNNKISKNQNRKIQKRQKRVKKHPRPPVWFPSGPLTNQVLPVHYIYVFYKRSRLPRDRYIGRRFRRSDDVKASFIKLNFTKLIDFTLRKRVKPIRKYHRKRSFNKFQENNLVIRRRPFKALLNENIRFRPLTKTRLGTQTDLVNSSLLKTKQRKKSSNTKQTSENLRIRQLRRRIQRQVLRPIARYKPRSGGFVWPGDYLRLESIKAPTLKNLQYPTVQPEVGSSSNLPIRKKKRRTIQEWQIQPKKYLIQKHNLKVLKKRLEKSQNFNQTSQKIQELKLTI